jgi:hypothetical protein
LSLSDEIEESEGRRGGGGRERYLGFKFSMEFRGFLLQVGNHKSFSESFVERVASIAILESISRAKWKEAIHTNYFSFSDRLTPFFHVISQYYLTSVAPKK